MLRQPTGQSAKWMSEQTAFLARFAKENLYVNEEDYAFRVHPDCRKPYCVAGCR